MKLLLTAQGFTTEEIVRSFEKLVGKDCQNISLGVINEGYSVELGDKRWIPEELQSVSKTIGGKMDLINLLALDKEKINERLSKLDAVYVMGGHTDYLMSVFNKSGFSNLLSDILKNKVYVGSSAGSMVMCKRIFTSAYREIYYEEGTYDVTKYMEYTDFVIKPHFNADNFPKVRKDILLKTSKGFNHIIYGLRNDQAICINENTTTFINGPIFAVLNGSEINNK